IAESYDNYVVMASRNGYVCKYDVTEIPVQSLSAKGVKGMNLRDDDVVGARYANSLSKDEVLMLTNRGAIKRESTAAMEINHRPAKGKPYLKSVKTNPYQFIGILSENVFRLKDDIIFRIFLKETAFVLPGSELKPDKYEHGVPVLEKEALPTNFLMDKNRPYESNRVLVKLAQSRQEVLEEAGAIPEEPESDDVMLDLEKILSTIEPDLPLQKEKKIVVEEPKDEEDDDDAVVIQQTLF
ncbi:MAG: DNA gyrase C-terminal beta-propeller domain-containing protein, partial [Candidatus Izemoplasmatales bacterium]|nr:DNA gyrase C-terminal beta-propeller domain-containing protein [Candidatus Izemoplasmatales bacterium]